MVWGGSRGGVPKPTISKDFRRFWSIFESGFANSGPGDRFWEWFSIFSNTLGHFYPRNKLFGRVLSSLGWIAWWGPETDNFEGFRRILKVFRALFRQFSDGKQDLGVVFDFFQHPRVLLPTKQAVWEGSKWPGVVCVVGFHFQQFRPDPLIRLEFASPKH